MGLQEVFVTNLRRMRKERGMTQKRLAESCGTVTSYIGQIEIKERFPSLPMIERMADALRVEPYRFFVDGDVTEYRIRADEVADVVRNSVMDFLSRNAKKN